MLTLKRWIFTLIAICVIALPIGILTFADDPTKEVTTSYGRTFIIPDRDRAHQEWTTHEEYLDDADDKMSDLIYEKDVIGKGVNRDRSGLRATIENTGITAIAGKRPIVIITL